MLLALKRLAYRVASPVVAVLWAVLGVRRDGAKCMLMNGEDVLLVRHTYGSRRHWDLPGGFVGRGEEPILAACREMEEELGLVLEPCQLAAVGRRALRIGRGRGTVHYFRVDLDDRRVRADPVELAEVRWFAREAPARPVGAHVEEALRWPEPR
ncbi:MAG: NUDIX hydrolase [Solirubrobacteraceae bacterium]